MVARVALYDLLNSDDALRQLGATSVYASAGVDTPADECFIIIRWEAAPAEFPNNGPANALIWAHDKQPNYDRIDRVLSRVAELVEGVLHKVGSDGWTLVQAKIVERSGDLYDDGFGTTTRYFTARVSSRYNGH